MLHYNENQIDIRKIYVGTIVKQGEVDVLMPNKIFPMVSTDKKIYNWEYKSEPMLGLFVKNIRGYKHILTGAIYKVESCKTSGEYVLIKNGIYEMCKYHKDIAKYLVQHNKSYYLTREQVHELEDRLNRDLSNEVNYEDMEDLEQNVEVQGSLVV